MDEIIKDEMRQNVLTVLQSRFDDVDRCMTIPGGEPIAMTYCYEACGVIAAAFAAELITADEMSGLHRELFERHYRVPEAATA